MSHDDSDIALEEEGRCSIWTIAHLPPFLSHMLPPRSLHLEIALAYEISGFLAIRFSLHVKQTIQKEKKTIRHLRGYPKMNRCHLPPDRE